ncbi:unnamed protein product [Paramecium octaurelia]|uniref:Uncharacterized protein n=1 Tax=Paramecium octaurelia TaxID=43137 RepID=A0A8S1YGJ2_PAROT|nr:unnamed protein product [Paramecium octaurelia]
MILTICKNSTCGRLINYKENQMYMFHIHLTLLDQQLHVKRSSRRFGGLIINLGSQILLESLTITNKSNINTDMNDVQT